MKAGGRARAGAVGRGRAPGADWGRGRGFTRALGPGAARTVEHVARVGGGNVEQAD